MYEKICSFLIEIFFTYFCSFNHKEYNNHDEVPDIQEEDNDTTVYNYDNNSGNYSAGNNYFYNITEFIMKNQQEYIEMLKEKIDSVKP